MSRDEKRAGTESVDLGKVWFLIRSCFAFVLGAIFMFIPFTELETGKPWYFWFASGLAAFALGAVLCYLVARRPH